MNLPDITLQRGLKAYLKRVVTAGDVFTNVLTGGLADETLSARWERNDQLGGPFFSHFASVVLTWFQFHHGMRALAHDEQRAENVADTEREAEGMDRDSENTRLLERIVGELEKANKKLDTIIANTGPKPGDDVASLKVTVDAPQKQ